MKKKSPLLGGLLPFLKNKAGPSVSFKDIFSITNASRILFLLPYF